jgi:hypothetical protein
MNKINSIITDIRGLSQDEIDEAINMITSQKKYNHPFKRGKVAEMHRIAEHNEHMINGLIKLKETIESWEEERAE